MARSRGLLVLGIAVAAAVAFGLVFALAGNVRVPLRFDAEGVTSMQLNAGTLTLADTGEPGLRASVPLRLLPLLMVRRTDGLLELGGFDDSDIRILFAGLIPFSSVPVDADDLTWELRAPEIDRITVAGGRLVAEGYSAERLAIFGASGEAQLDGLRVGTFAVHTQDPAVVRLSGRAETYSSMDSGGTLDDADLAYGRYDRQVIVDYFD